jgi:hypothetical protein
MRDTGSNDGARLLKGEVRSWAILYTVKLAALPHAHRLYLIAQFDSVPKAGSAGVQRHMATLRVLLAAEPEVLPLDHCSAN